METIEQFFVIAEHYAIIGINIIFALMYLSQVSVFIDCIRHHDPYKAGDSLKLIIVLVIDHVIFYGYLSIKEAGLIRLLNHY